MLGEMVHFAPYYILHNKQRRTSWQLVRFYLFSFQLPDGFLHKPPAQPASKPGGDMIEKQQLLFTLNLNGIIIHRQIVPPSSLPGKNPELVRWKMSNHLTR